VVAAGSAFTTPSASHALGTSPAPIRRRGKKTSVFAENTHKALKQGGEGVSSGFLPGQQWHKLEDDSVLFKTPTTPSH
jgi:hypothetical protein